MGVSILRSAISAHISLKFRNDTPAPPEIDLEMDSPISQTLINDMRLFDHVQYSFSSSIVRLP